MDLKLTLTVFTSIFLAELGDKTQLATLLYASGTQNSKWAVFIGAAMALVLTSAIGVLLGSLLSRYLNPKLLNWMAGLGFIAIGIWILIKG